MPKTIEKYDLPSLKNNIICCTIPPTILNTKILSLETQIRKVDLIFHFSSWIK